MSIWLVQKPPVCLDSPSESYDEEDEDELSQSEPTSDSQSDCSKEFEDDDFDNKSLEIDEEERNKISAQINPDDDEEEDTEGDFQEETENGEEESGDNGTDDEDKGPVEYEDVKQTKVLEENNGCPVRPSYRDDRELTPRAVACPEEEETSMTESSESRGLGRKFSPPGKLLAKHEQKHWDQHKSHSQLGEPCDQKRAKRDVASSTLVTKEVSRSSTDLKEFVDGFVSERIPCQNGELATLSTQTGDVPLKRLLAGVAPGIPMGRDSLTLRSGDWSCHSGLDGVFSNLLTVSQDLDSASFNSLTSSGSFSDQFKDPPMTTSGLVDQRNLGTKVEMVCSLLSMLGTQDKEDMSRTLFAMSQSQDNCIAMRQAGCLPILLQILHGSDKDSGLLGNIRGSRSARARAAAALHNLVHCYHDDKRSRREARTLRLLEQVRAHCDQQRLESDHEQAGAGHLEMDHQPGAAIAALMKLSFDEDYRHAICALGGLQAIAELLEVDNQTVIDMSDYSTTIRRYSCMALTNLTFGDGKNKALLCSLPATMQALSHQLQAANEDLIQAAASVLRNLSWRADLASKRTLREIGVVTTLMQAAMQVKKETTLKSILSALWNLSSHCSENKAEICAVEGALQFLVGLLTYKSSTQTLAIIENGGGILRNVSSQIATREEYRKILRQCDCLRILLSHLKSPSLTIVSNACGTLWNLSARCEQDQLILREMGAVSMLRNLVHSRHKMISSGSSAALKNLLSSVPTGKAMEQDRLLGSSLPSLHVRKQRALEAELDHNLSETWENMESPRNSPTEIVHRSESEPRRFVYHLSSPGGQQQQEDSRTHMTRRQMMSRNGCEANNFSALISGCVGRAGSQDSIRSTHSDISHDRARSQAMLARSHLLLQRRQSSSLDRRGTQVDRLQAKPAHSVLSDLRINSDLKTFGSFLQEQDASVYSDCQRSSHSQSNWLNQTWHSLPDQTSVLSPHGANHTPIGNPYHYQHPSALSHSAPSHCHVFHLPDGPGSSRQQQTLLEHLAKRSSSLSNSCNLTGSLESSRSSSPISSLICNGHSPHNLSSPCENQDRSLHHSLRIIKDNADNNKTNLNMHHSLHITSSNKFNSSGLRHISQNEHFKSNLVSGIANEPKHTLNNSLTPDRPQVITTPGPVTLTSGGHCWGQNSVQNSCAPQVLRPLPHFLHNHFHKEPDHQSKGEQLYQSQLVHSYPSTQIMNSPDAAISAHRSDQPCLDPSLPGQTSRLPDLSPKGNPGCTSAGGADVSVTAQKFKNEQSKDNLKHDYKDRPALPLYPAGQSFGPNSIKNPSRDNKCNSAMTVDDASDQDFSHITSLLTVESLDDSDIDDGVLNNFESLNRLKTLSSQESMCASLDQNLTYVNDQASRLDRGDTDLDADETSSDEETHVDDTSSDEQAYVVSGPPGENPRMYSNSALACSSRTDWNIHASFSDNEMADRSGDFHCSNKAGAGSQAEICQTSHPEATSRTAAARGSPPDRSGGCLLFSAHTEKVELTCLDDDSLSVSSLTDLKEVIPSQMFEVNNSRSPFQLGLGSLLSSDEDSEPNTLNRSRSRSPPSHNNLIFPNNFPESLQSPNAKNIIVKQALNSDKSSSNAMYDPFMSFAAFDEEGRPINFATKNLDLPVLPGFSHQDTEQSCNFPSLHDKDQPLVTFSTFQKNFQSTNSSGNGHLPNRFYSQRARAMPTVLEQMAESDPQNSVNEDPDNNSKWTVDRRSLCSNSQNRVNSRQTNFRALQSHDQQKLNLPMVEEEREDKLDLTPEPSNSVPELQSRIVTTETKQPDIMSGGSAGFDTQTGRVPTAAQPEDKISRCSPSKKRSGIPTKLSSSVVLKSSGKLSAPPRQTKSSCNNEKPLCPSGSEDNGARFLEFDTAENTSGNSNNLTKNNISQSSNCSKNVDIDITSVKRAVFRSVSQVGKTYGFEKSKEDDIFENEPMTPPPEFCDDDTETREAKGFESSNRSPASIDEKGLTNFHNPKRTYNAQSTCTNPVPSEQVLPLKFINQQSASNQEDEQDDCLLSNSRLITSVPQDEYLQLSDVEDILDSLSKGDLSSASQEDDPEESDPERGMNLDMLTGQEEIPRSLSSSWVSPEDSDSHDGNQAADGIQEDSTVAGNLSQDSSLTSFSSSDRMKHIVQSTKIPNLFAFWDKNLEAKCRISYGSSSDELGDYYSTHLENIDNQQNVNSFGIKTKHIEDASDVKNQSKSYSNFLHPMGDVRNIYNNRLAKSASFEIGYNSSSETEPRSQSSLSNHLGSSENFMSQSSSNAGDLDLHAQVPLFYSQQSRCRKWCHQRQLSDSSVNFDRTRNSFIEDISPEEAEKLLSENVHLIVSEIQTTKMSGSSVDDDLFIEHETISLVSHGYTSDTNSEISATLSVLSDKTSDMSAATLPGTRAVSKLTGPKVVKPTAVQQILKKSLPENEEVKSVRGRRKPLYPGKQNNLLTVAKANLKPVGRVNGVVGLKGVEPQTPVARPENSRISLGQKKTLAKVTNKTPAQTKAVTAQNSSPKNQSPPQKVVTRRSRSAGPPTNPVQRGSITAKHKTLPVLPSAAAGNQQAGSKSAAVSGIKHSNSVSNKLSSQGASVEQPRQNTRSLSLSGTAAALEQSKINGKINSNGAVPTSDHTRPFTGSSLSPGNSKIPTVKNVASNQNKLQNGSLSGRSMNILTAVNVNNLTAANINSLTLANNKKNKQLNSLTSRTPSSSALSSTGSDRKSAQNGSKIPNISQINLASATSGNNNDLGVTRKKSNSSSSPSSQQDSNKVPAFGIKEAGKLSSSTATDANKTTPADSNKRTSNNLTPSRQTPQVKTDVSVKNEAAIGTESHKTNSSISKSTLPEPNQSSRSSPSNTEVKKRSPPGIGGKKVAAPSRIATLWKKDSQLDKSPSQSSQLSSASSSSKLPVTMAKSSPATPKYSNLPQHFKTKAATLPNSSLPSSKIRTFSERISKSSTYEKISSELTDQRMKGNNHVASSWQKSSEPSNVSSARKKPAPKSVLAQGKVCANSFDESGTESSGNDQEQNFYIKKNNADNSEPKVHLNSSANSIKLHINSSDDSSEENVFNESDHRQDVLRIYSSASTEMDSLQPLDESAIHIDSSTFRKKKRDPVNSDLPLPNADETCRSMSDSFEVPVIRNIIGVNYKYSLQTHSVIKDLNFLDVSQNEMTDSIEKRNLHEEDKSGKTKSLVAQGLKKLFSSRHKDKDKDSKEKNLNREWEKSRHYYEKEAKSKQSKSGRNKKGRDKREYDFFRSNIKIEPSTTWSVEDSLENELETSSILRHITSKTDSGQVHINALSGWNSTVSTCVQSDVDSGDENSSVPEKHMTKTEMLLARRRRTTTLSGSQSDESQGEGLFMSAHLVAAM